MINEETLSPLDCTSSTESFITPVSSMGDLMALSPKRQNNDIYNHIDNDLLTGTNIDDICDVTMHEIPVHEDVYLDKNDIDYLVKCSDNRSVINDIDKGRESLFVKFDPLYSRKRDVMNTKHNKTINIPEYDVGYETGSSTTNMDQHVMTPKRTVSTTAMQYHSNKEKPMQIVPPAVNHTIASINPSQNRGVPALVRSVSAIMSPAQVAIDRLINIAGTSPPPQPAPRSTQYEHYNSQNTDRLYSLRIILQKQEQEIHELRQENRELKYNLQDSEKKTSRLVEEMDAKVKKLSEDKENLMMKERKLAEQIRDKITSNKQMSIVMEEYEKTISSLIGEHQKEVLQHKEIQEKMSAERDEALSHLSNMETSFNDLLAKYEKCKAIIIETKEREKLFEQKISEYEKSIKKYETLYENLKDVTRESLDKANETLDSIKKNHSAEITKYNATIKKQEIQILSLQESLTQKDRDNQQLTSICDELINKVR